MRELIKLTGILTLICCCASLALALVYGYTREPIAYQQKLKKIRAVNAVLPQFEDAPGLRMVDAPLCEDETAQQACRRFYLIRNDSEVLGTAFEVTASGYGGPVSIMVGVAGARDLSGIAIISHGETPGLGANITRESFLSQFAALDPDTTRWQLRKKGGDIDQVSGATISSTAVVNAVHEGLTFYVQHRDEIVANGSGS